MSILCACLLLGDALPEFLDAGLREGADPFPVPDLETRVGTFPEFTDEGRGAGWCRWVWETDADKVFDDHEEHYQEWGLAMPGFRPPRALQAPTGLDGSVPGSYPYWHGMMTI